MPELPDAPESVAVELRCPAGPPAGAPGCNPGRLFARLLIAGERPAWVQPDNLIEMACGDCKRRLERRGRRVRRVLHRFAFSGELVGTLVDEGAVPRGARRNRSGEGEITHANDRPA